MAKLMQEATYLLGCQYALHAQAAFDAMALSVQHKALLLNHPGC